MQVKDFTNLIEQIAPLSLQEDYDNAGLLVGRPEMTVTGILLSLDTTENIIDEALKNGCNLIISHHPIIFRGLKKINGANHIERTIIKAIQNNIAIYAAHTNLDNILQNGVNEKIAQKLGLSHLQILQPKSNTISKMVIYSPPDYAIQVKDCLFKSGAGEIGNYSECSFISNGIGSFKPNEAAHPFNGMVGERKDTDEVKIEVIIHNHQITNALKLVKEIHPYEEVAYDIHPLTNMNQSIGAGIYGILDISMTSTEFLNYLKDKMNLDVIKHTFYSKNIKKVAICGGAGSFLIQNVKGKDIDAYITSDVKYHEFFDVENQFLLCDIGHYESEIYTLEIFYDVIREKYPTFAVIFCEENTNPIQYFK